jgi:hypothetical protein
LKKHSRAWLASILGRGTEDWMIALLYEAQVPLIQQRNQLREREKRVRARDLRKAREYLGEVVER